MQSYTEARQTEDSLALLRLERGVTMDLAIKGTVLKVLESKIGSEELIILLAGIILRTAAFFNLYKSMTDEQALDTASILIEKYQFETVEDFVLMFREGKAGKYGHLKNRLDGQIIFDWMEKYMDQKADHRENIHRSQKNNHLDMNLLEAVQSHSGEEEQQDSPLNQAVSKPGVITNYTDAMKKAIDFDSLEKNEKDYQEFRKKFFKKDQPFE